MSGREAPILAVCGIKREAAIWGGPAVCSGGDTARLNERIEAAIAQHAPEAILSFGVAGALDPALSVGDVVIASAVITRDGKRFVTDQDWTAKIAQAVGARRVDFVGSSEVAAAVAAKAALLRYGAAVDMESHVAAETAARYALPFAVLRVISDSAGDVLPPAAVAGMRQDGEIDVMAVLGRLALDPRQLSALMRVSRNAGRAFRRLQDARDLLAADRGL